MPVGAQFYVRMARSHRLTQASLVQCVGFLILAASTVACASPRRYKSSADQDLGIGADGGHSTDVETPLDVQLADASADATGVPDLSVGAEMDMAIDLDASVTLDAHDVRDTSVVEDASIVPDSSTCAVSQRLCAGECVDCPWENVRETDCLEDRCVVASCAPAFDLNASGECTAVSTAGTWATTEVDIPAPPSSAVSASADGATQRLLGYVDADGVVHSISGAWFDSTVPTVMPAREAAIVANGAQRFVYYVSGAGALRRRDLDDDLLSDVELIGSGVQRISAAMNSWNQVFVAYQRPDGQLRVLFVTDEGSTDTTLSETGETPEAFAVAVHPTSGMATAMYCTSGGALKSRQWTGSTWSVSRTIRLVPTHARSIAATISPTRGFRAVLVSPGGGARLVRYEDYWRYDGFELDDAPIRDVALAAFPGGDMFAAFVSESGRVLFANIY